MSNKFDINKLKELRERSGVSFALCKKALEETNNDMEKAVKKLQEIAGIKVAEKSSRTALDGGLFSYFHHNRKIASLVEIVTETDFVSGNEQFQSLGSEIAMHIASIPSKTVKELLTQEYVRDPSKTISDLIKESVLKFGENIQIKRFLRWELGE